MPSIKLPVASYNQPSRVPQRLVNVYPQATPGKGPVELLGAPGTVAWSAPGSGPGRGLFVMRGTLYCVSGEALYKVDENGSEIYLGALPGSGKLQFAGNGVELVFSNKYILSNGTVSLITDPDLPAISSIDYIDGYVVATETGTGKFYWSELYDGANYDGLSFASAEGYPDDLICLKVDHRQVFLFGQETTEIWYDSGDLDYRFQRLSGGFIELGAGSRLGVTKQDNSVLWFANDKTIRRLSESTPVRVSQHGMEEKIASYDRVDDCEAFSFAWNGHLFCAFTFPSATPEGGATWVLDITAGNEWHERSTYGQNDWDVVDAVNCYGKVLMQRRSTGEIGYLSDSCYTEFGETLRKEWTYPQVYQTNYALTHSQLDIVCRTGNSPIGEVAHVNLEISDDGGNTWMTLPPRELGRTGEYGHVVRWNRLGQARDRVYRASVDDANVPLCVTDSVLRVE